MENTHKPGWQTSEFWVSMLAVALPLVLPLLESALGNLPTDSWSSILGTAIVAAGYSVSRAVVKRPVSRPAVPASADVSSIAKAVLLELLATNVGPAAQVNDEEFFRDAVEPGPEHPSS